VELGNGKNPMFMLLQPGSGIVALCARRPHFERAAAARSMPMSELRGAFLRTPGWTTSGIEISALDGAKR
jgi:hypothetical protein